MKAPTALQMSVMRLGRGTRLLSTPLSRVARPEGRGLFGVRLRCVRADSIPCTQSGSHQFGVDQSMLMGRRWSRSPTVTDCGPVWSRIPARNSANPQILKALFHNLYVHYSPFCHEARPEHPTTAGDRHRVGWPLTGEPFRFAGPVQRTSMTERCPMGWMGRLLGPPLR